MTIMFTAFEGKPNTLRLYGQARAVHKNDADWAELSQYFDDLPGARQIFDLDVDLVQNSCGMSIPYYSYDEERTLLSDWATKQGDSGLKNYWQKKNQKTIDGIDTHILEKNT